MADPPPFDPSKPSQAVTGNAPAFDPAKPTLAAGSGEPREGETSAGGLAASFTRGLAPIAAGAGIGAAAGSVIPGIGTAVGAGAGAGAAGLTELATAVYKPLARHMGWPDAASPQEMTDKVLDAFGMKRPSTTPERMAETAGGTLPFGLTAGGLGDAIASNSAGKVDSFIKSAYQRAIKPTVERAGTAPELAKYNQQARSAIDSIVANKPALRFVGEEGETAGKLPKTIEQFGDAIDQTKQSIFEKYDAMARAAGQAGARVDLHPAASELQKIAADPVVRDLHPELAKYAEDQAGRLAVRGSYSTVDAQRAIQNLNQSLKAFYKSPTYETAGRAGVDAMVANQFRSGLDKAIEGATGPGYQALKNEYGSLKAIEKDVIHRAVFEGRKNLGGGLMGNIGDLVSADEVIRGVLTLNPAAVARGAALKGFTAFVKRMRDPNRAIEKIFDAAEKQTTAREAARAGLPTHSATPPLALPAPEVAGPGAPWVQAGDSLMPSGPNFRMRQPSPSGLADHPAEVQRAIKTLERYSAKAQPKALPAPPARPLLPRPGTIYGPQRAPISTGTGYIPGSAPGFTTPNPALSDADAVRRILSDTNPFGAGPGF